jgi:hypothetical protein
LIDAVFTIAAPGFMCFTAVCAFPCKCDGNRAANTAVSARRDRRLACQAGGTLV